MIVRVFRCRVRPEKQTEFEPFFYGKAIDNVRAHPGLVDVLVGRPLPVSPDEYLMTTVWRDLDALKAFAGPDWQRPYIDPAEADLITDVTVHHYEGGRVDPPAAP